MANSSLIKNHVSTTEMAKDIANGTLPNFAFITPDGDHDMHDCGANLNACFRDRRSVAEEQYRAVARQRSVSTGRRRRTDHLGR